MELKRDMHKDEVEAVLRGKGEFVQIDYLNRYLKLMPPIEMKKFAFLKLAQIYESRKLYSDVARCYRNIAMIALTFKDKFEFLMKETEAWIKAGEFFEADKSMKNALIESSVSEKPGITKQVIGFYKAHAELLEKEMKRNQATKYYEKLLKMEIGESEKQIIKNKLGELYERLGKIREKSMINRNEEIARRRSLF
jgi:tetratricopeptide (TPR) repeat protein